MQNNPIICALDSKDINQAIKIINQTKEYINYYKLGLEFFTAFGPQGVKKIKELGVKIFLDMKYHDIPKQISSSMKAAMDLDVDIVTIHSLGGKEMMAETISEAEKYAKLSKVKLPRIAAVTILTSMDQSQLKDIGIERKIKDQVLHLVGIAYESGVRNFVCSPHEIEAIKAKYKDVTLIVPGIRPESSKSDDQKRIMTPKEAIDKGADFLVIGRPITKSETPSIAIKEIFETINI